MTIAKVLVGSALGTSVLALMALPAGCGGEPTSPVARSRTTHEYQQALLKDVTPVIPTVVGTTAISVKPTQKGMMATPPWAANPSNMDAGSPPEDQQLVSYLEASQPVVQSLRYDSEELAALAAKVVPLGIAEPVQPDQVPLQEKGWSSAVSSGNGVDNRVNLSGFQNWEYRTVGRLWAAGGCTATFFGRRLIITAAHCVIDPNGNYAAGTFQPAVNGGTLPFGQQSVVAAWWGGNYISKCTGGAPGYWSDCVPEDWALLLLQDNFPQGHPGWLGYAWLGQSDIQNWTKREVGYPGCGFPESPTNCQAERLYGQTTGCSFGQFMFPFGNGFNSTFSHGCDNGPGHSGSGMYTTGLGSFHIFAVASTQRCSTCTVAQEPSATIRANPNLEKRLDSFIFNLMSNLRATYP